MRFTQQEKYEIIRLVETSEIGVNRTLKEIGLHKSTFYNCYGKYREDGFDGLAPKSRARNTYWNKIPDKIHTEVIDMALEYPEESSRGVACKMIDDKQYYISESSVLLSDNVPCYISQELKQFMNDKNIKHIRGRPMHPQTQGKIERYHRSMKNIIKLEHYYFPEELKQRLAEFIDYYNNRRYHESLENVTPADVYFGRKESILKQRQIIKEKTMNKRRKTHVNHMLNL